MTYCCECIKTANELIVRVGNALNWSSDLGVGDGILGGLTLGIWSTARAASNVDEAISKMRNAYNILINAQKAIDLCSCGSERSGTIGDYNKLVGEYNVLREKYNALVNKHNGSLESNKKDYNKLVNEYNELLGRSKNNISDYNNLRDKYNNLVNEYNNLSKESVKDYNILKEKYNKLVDEYNDKNSDYHDMKEKFKDTNEKLHSEKLKHANESGNEKLKHLGEKSQLQIQNTKLQEKLEAANSEKIDLRRRLKDKEDENNRLLLKLDDKNNQLTVLRIESGEKDSRLRERESELTRKNEEIERLKRKGGLSQEELLTEKLRSEKGNLELLANELKIGSEQIHSLTKYHERLFVAQKNHNQANIDIHEENISKVKQELTDQEISVVHIQEICRKCEAIAKLRWELEQSQQRFEARQEVPTNH